ncbi:hypothetical protein RJ641_003921 [Dillenia turbinata]|uniref:Uncharacterized protein n=1 Tax=Dillenia turbinata TaxID=194707 RepID=A0AAN8VI46_9MAGN
MAMADITVFMTSNIGSLSGSAVHMNTSIPGRSSSFGNLSGKVVRATSRHRYDMPRSQMNERSNSEAYSSNP